MVKSLSIWTAQQVMVNPNGRGPVAAAALLSAYKDGNEPKLEEVVVPQQPTGQKDGTW